MAEDEFETTEFKEKLEEATEWAVEAAEHRAMWVVALLFSTAIIAVSAVAALSRQKIVWIVGLGISGIGLLYFIDGFRLFF